MTIFPPLKKPQTVVTFQWCAYFFVHMKFNVPKIVYNGLMLGTGPRGTTFVGLTLVTDKSAIEGREKVNGLSLQKPGTSNNES